MRKSLRRKLLFTDSNNSNTCSSRKIPGSIKPEKVFLLVDLRLNLELLKVNSRSLKKLGNKQSKLRILMTLKTLDLEKWELTWILMVLVRLLVKNRMLTKLSKIMKIPRWESTMPRPRLRKLRTKRDNKSLMLQLSEKILLTKLRNKREITRSMILKDSWWVNKEILKMPRVSLINGRLRDTLLLRWMISVCSKNTKQNGIKQKKTSKRFRRRLTQLMLNSKLRKPVRKQETLMNKWNKQLEISNRDLVRESSNSINLKELEMTPKPISQIIWMKSNNSKLNSNQIQPIQHFKQTCKLLRVKQKVWDKPEIKPKNPWPQCWSLKVRIELMPLLVLSLLLTPTWVWLSQTSMLLKKNSIKLWRSSQVLRKHTIE